jgi:phosphoserine phosphatase
MAEITLTVVGTTVGTISSTLTLTSADSDRLLAFLAATYGTDAEGNARTPQQMIEAYWAAMAAGTVSSVQRWEQEQAAQTAREAVPPLTVT